VIAGNQLANLLDLIRFGHPVVTRLEVDDLHDIFQLEDMVVALDSLVKTQ